MGKRKLRIFLVALMVLTAYLPFLKVQEAKANPSFITKAPINHAYILNNGEIDPPTLPIKQTGNIYTLTDNILNYTIIIQKNNIILDGNGYVLTSILKTYLDPYSNSGSSSIQITNKTNIIIRNIKFERCYGGITVRNSTNITIFQNTMINGISGIHMYQSTNCNIIGNKITDNSGSGLHIMESSFINITYNTILRNHGHGGWIAISNSNISRNDINNNDAPNVGIGLYLYGPNINNYIFENNFIDNEIGLFYQGAQGISANNTVHDNFWSNYEDEIVNVAADEVSGVDQFPLSKPIPLSFNPNLFHWFSLTQFPDPTPIHSPSSESSQLAFPSTIEIVAIVILVVIALGLAVNFVKKRRI